MSVVVATGGVTQTSWSGAWNAALATNSLAHLRVHRVVLDNAALLCADVDGGGPLAGVRGAGALVRNRTISPLRRKPLPKMVICVPPAYEPWFGVM